MCRLLRLYRRGLGAHLRAQPEYEADFWILIIAGVLTQSLGIFLLGAIFARVPLLHGWRFEEVVLIYGLAGVSAGLVPVLIDGIWMLSGQIHWGELDYRLVRPYPPVLQVMSGSLGMNGIGDIIGAGALLIWALIRVDVAWSVGTVVIGLLLLASVAVVRMAITVASNAASFWLRSPHPMLAQALNEVGELTRYPLSIYGMALRVLVAVVVPFAFASFFPAAWVLSKGGYAWLGPLTPLVALACSFIAYQIFQRGLRRHESSGH